MSSHSYDQDTERDASEFYKAQLLAMGADRVHKCRTEDCSTFYGIHKGGEKYSLEIFDSSTGELPMLSYYVAPKVSRTLEAPLPECLARLQSILDNPESIKEAVKQVAPDYPNRPDRQFWHMVGAVVAFIVGLVICCLATGCMTEKRALKKLGGIAARQPDAALRFCADLHPPKIETRTDIEYLPGATVYDTAMVYADCDSFIKYQQNTKVLTKYVGIKCPPSSHTTDTIVKTITNTVTNTAKEQVLSKDLEKATAEVTRLKKGKKTATIAAISLGVLLAAGFVLKLKKIV